MKLTTGLCALGLSMLLLGGCAQQERRMEALTEQAAQTLAVEAAGLSGTEVVFASTELERRDGVDYYQVVFSSGEKNYECDVDAITGSVIEVRQPTEVDVLQNGAEGLSSDTPPEGSLVTDADTYNPAVPAGQSGTPSGQESTAANQNNASSGQGGQQGSSGQLTAQQAKEKALAHANLTLDEVVFVVCELDWEHGRQVYEVEFYTNDAREFDYEIDASTGEVLSYDYDAEHYTPPSTGSEGSSISQERAKEIALAQVPGAALSDIREFETDYDDGRLEYEGKIFYGGMEYEFTIDGYSGAIREWEADSIYD